MFEGSRYGQKLVLEELARYAGITLENMCSNSAQTMVWARFYRCGEILTTQRDTERLHGKHS